MALNPFFQFLILFGQTHVSRKKAFKGQSRYQVKKNTKKRQKKIKEEKRRMFQIQFLPVQLFFVPQISRLGSGDHALVKSFIVA